MTATESECRSNIADVLLNGCSVNHTATHELKLQRVTLINNIRALNLHAVGARNQLLPPTYREKWNIKTLGEFNDVVSGKLVVSNEVLIAMIYMAQGFLTFAVADDAHNIVLNKQ